MYLKDIPRSLQKQHVQLRAYSLGLKLKTQARKYFGRVRIVMKLNTYQTRVSIDGETSYIPLVGVQGSGL